MRISKVTVQEDNRNGNGKMVRMIRNVREGMLVYADDKLESARTAEILPKKKQQSFNLSVLNKTLIKKERLKDKALKEVHKELEKLLKKTLPNWDKLTDKAKVWSCVSEKFQKPIEFQQGGKKHKFELIDLILSAAKERSIAPLIPYYEWKAWYIQEKSDKLKKSVEHNRIQLEDESTPSPRKRALRQWRAEVKENSLDLEDYHKSFGINRLADKLNNVEKPKQDEHGQIKDSNAFYRLLKKELQEHQREVFGSRENPNETNRHNEKLYVYSTEVAKYMEHYFPLKKSGRCNSMDDITHYLKPETIKRTIEHQIVNAIRLDLLQQGKFEHHECHQEVDSTRLSNIKADESFVLHLSEMCAFAANNIRNMVDRGQDKDVLGEDVFQKSIDKNPFDIDLFRFFYNYNDEKGAKKIADLTQQDKWAMQQAVAQIRHQVVHYRKEAVQRIFGIDQFSYGKPKVTAHYIDTIFKQCLANDKAKLPESFAEQLKTGGVLTYYPMSKLQSFLEGNRFHLCRSVVPFAPGFKNVMKEGRNYQYANQTPFYDLGLTCYMQKKEAYGDDDRYEAQYFLLKLVYNNMFLPAFTDEKTPLLFRESVGFVLKQNRAYAAKTNKEYAQAFKEVPQMEAGQTVSAYMALVQSRLMIEENVKREDTTRYEKEEARINFKKFLLQLFVKGFDTYLSKHPEMAFIMDPTEPEEQLVLDNLEKEILSSCQKAVSSSASIDETNGRQIAFYTFCKLLDANHLSTLRNELIKYRSAAKNGKDNIGHIEQLLAIIELCLLKADVVKLPEGASAIQNDAYKDYIEPGVDYKQWEAYTASDNTTEILHRTIALSRNYGTEGLLKALIASDDTFRITSKEHDKWKNMKENVKEATEIRCDLHRQWVEAKNKDATVKKGEKRETVANYMKIHKEEYQKLCKAIDRYNWLNNKLQFEHLRRLQNITIEILARMAGFITLWERDFRYYDQKMKLNGGKMMEWEDNSGLPDWEECNVYLGSFLPKEILGTKKKGEPIYLYRKTRNYIAHFNYLSEPASSFSLMDLINNLRCMFFYDRKLKNAVTKAFIKLFDKHGMELTLKREVEAGKEIFVVADITPKVIYHLDTKKGKDKIKTQQVTTDYCRMCKALLALKKGKLYK